MSEVISIQLGKVRSYGLAVALDPMDQVWTTATFKQPVDGPVWLGVEGFAGDEQADRRFHGGPDKAALVYSFDHYAAWHEEIFPEPLPEGAFGENILVSGMSEKDVCVGDVYTLGEARVQVSQPRKPCGKQARRWRIKDLVVRMIRAGRTGWYLRVLREGNVRAGDRFDLEARPCPEWPVPRAHEVMHFKKQDVEAARELEACPALAEEWKSDLRKRF